MQKPVFDPGFTNQYAGNLRRVINRDGTFNIHRRGGSWRDTHPYLHLINMGWPYFLALVFLGYLLANTIFASLYMMVGAHQVAGAEAPTAFGRFVNLFFFSAQTLTTVGFGGMLPKGIGANIISAIESMTGVLGFALATGLLFGRVSRPSARIGFSESALIAPYQEGASLQFRVVNLRPNQIIDVEARVMLTTVDRTDGTFQRNYRLLTLERSGVLFFPLTWTVVHPIDAQSPLYGKTLKDLEKLQAEVMVLLRGYDDTFSQTVHTRYSYRYNEIIWGARFTPAFEIDPEGGIDVHVDRISNNTKAPLKEPAEIAAT